MLRSLSAKEVSLVAGGMEVYGDFGDIEGGNWGYFADSGGFTGGDWNSGGDVGGGGGGYYGGDFGDDNDVPQISVDFGNDLNDSTVTDNGPNENDIIVTAPFTKAQVDSMYDEAKHYTDVQFTAIDAGLALASYAAGLGVIGGTAVAVGGGAAMNNKSYDRQTEANFQYIYSRQLAINNGTASYGNGYPALQFPTQQQ